MPHNNKQVKILLADRHQIFRSGLRKTLEKYPGLIVLDEAGNGQELLDKLQYLHPDIIVTGLRMPVMDALQTLPHIRRLHPAIKVIVVSMVDDADIIKQTLEKGASAYLLKTASSEEIYEAIITCYRQWFYFNDLVAKAALKYKPGKLKEEIPGLFNKTELTILKMLQHNEPIRSIMLACDLSERTVLAIVERMKEKTGKATQEELLQFVNEEKFLV